MGELVNWGAEHSLLHTNQAIKCWSEVDSYVQEWLGERGLGERGSMDHKLRKSVDKYRDIARANMQVLREKKMFPYSKG